MIRRAFDGNGSLETIECINPDSSIAVKLESRFDVRALRLYRDVPSFQDYGF
jgi:hypothetical protein